MSNEPTWLDEEFVVEAHDRTISVHGGLGGVRDKGALQSALARPFHKWNYRVADLFELAAAYGFGLARNHAFADRNKRIAFIATRFFLLDHGVTLTATDDDKIATFLALAAGELDEDGLAAWLRAHATPA